MLFVGIAVAVTILVISWWLAALRGYRARKQITPAGPPDRTRQFPLQDPTWPPVSVLVPAWCESSTIERCLQALERVDYPQWETIVIAGGPDGTYETVDRRPIRENFLLLRQGPGGKNAALNQGLAPARGEVIVVLDADSVVDPYWLRELVRPLMHGADAACGNYLPLRQTWVSQVEEMEKTAAYLIHKQVILQGSGSIAIRREALEETGCFPEGVTTGVDWDLSTRLAKAGRILSFAEGAFVWTQRPATLSEFWKNEVRWRRAHLRSTLENSLHPLDIQALLAAVRFYGFILALGFGALLGLGCAMVGKYPQAGWIFTGLALLLITLSGRRAALSLEVASYTGEWRRLSRSWAPAFLLLVSFAASGLAMVTLNKRTVHFKGPRR